MRWDNCINNAINGNVFAYSWYLNILSDQWEALVLGNYDYIMPLFRKKKYNKDIYYTSKLGIRLGVFSSKLLSEEIVKKFIDAIPKKNSIVDIPLNAYNQIKSKNVRNNSTYELDLILSHKRIAENYTNQFQKDLEIAKKNNISVVKGLLPNDLINFSRSKNVLAKPRLNTEEIQKLRMIIAYCLRYSLGESYSAYGAHNNLLASAFFIRSKKKIHLLYAANSKYGIESNAFHLLIDKYIEVHSEKDLTLSIENVISNNNQGFFAGLGAKENKFQQYYINNLSLFYKMIIK
ncbi:MAG: hypothetical protein C0597_16725 [Marinilabiliales bacterium]|nr:MAG: hypothetical protein C0597_16725 [Marinilabiliales bacterium]